MFPPSTLFEAHQEHALRLARAWRRRVPLRVQTCELESAALEGLWRASLSYDPERLLLFWPTWAHWKIRSALLDYLRSLQPRTQQRQQYCKHPCPRVMVQSLDALEHPDRHPALATTPPDTTLKEEVRDRLRCLPRRSQLILRLYYFRGWRMHRIAARLGLSECRISQILTALARQFGGARGSHAARPDHP